MDKSSGKQKNGEKKQTTNLLVDKTSSKKCCILTAHTQITVDRVICMFNLARIMPDALFRNPRW